MGVHEIFDPDEARRFLVAGLWLQRVSQPHAESVSRALEWLLELVSAGDPVPPVGFLADLGTVVFGVEHEVRTGPGAVEVPGWTQTLARPYEDHVLGKFYADTSFARAGDALRRFQGRDRAKGLAYLFNRFRERAAIGGVMLNPAAIKAVLDRPAALVLAEGWDILERDGIPTLLPVLYAALIRAARVLADVLASEDVFELEHGTALAPFGERIALRQVLQSAAEFEAALTDAWPRPPARRQDVATRVLDEDMYPVGGFSSISTRGTVESLLHSQLAFMEADERPDLFDIKYVRDELLYYARDENQFHRQRRTYVFAFFPDLVQARFKDAQLPRQRIILLLALLIAAVRKLTEWLSQDSLLFEFLFLETSEVGALAPEQALVEMVLREAIANGTVAMTRLPAARLRVHCDSRASRSLCHCLCIAATDQPIESDSTVVTRFVVHGPRPALGIGDDRPTRPEGDDAVACWESALVKLMPIWL